MRFWDSSALVPLCLGQAETARSREWHREDPEVAVWWGSYVECASAIARVQRAGAIASSDAARALETLASVLDISFEVTPAEVVRAQALRLLRIHPLRAGDALQLAAAIEWSGSPPTGEFVTFDERLADAATREGFSVLS
ncbi:MAG: type II toxin-antitoxin system VapC family toxin [Gemmatimonadaceae bacterium]